MWHQMSTHSDILKNQYDLVPPICVFTWGSTCVGMTLTDLPHGQGQEYWMSLILESIVAWAHRVPRICFFSPWPLYNLYKLHKHNGSIIFPWSINEPMINPCSPSFSTMNFHESSPLPGSSTDSSCLLLWALASQASYRRWPWPKGCRRTGCCCWQGVNNWKAQLARPLGIQHLSFGCLGNCDLNRPILEF